METATRVHENPAQPSIPAEKNSLSVVLLVIASAVLLALRFYFVRELLVLLTVLGVFFAVCTGALLLLILLQELAHWSVRRFIDARQGTIFFDGAQAFRVHK